MEKPWKNAEGYSDPTAYAALKAVGQEEAEQQQRVSALVRVLKYIIDKDQSHAYNQKCNIYKMSRFCLAAITNKL